MVERFKECDKCLFCIKNAIITLNFATDVCYMYEKINGKGSGELNRVYEYTYKNENGGTRYGINTGCSCYVNRYNVIENEYKKKVEQMKTTYGEK